MFEDIIKELSKKYKLSIVDKRRLNTEAEMVMLKVEFAAHKARKLHKSFYDSMVHFTGLNRYTQKLTDIQKKELESQIKNMKSLNPGELESLARALFKKCDYTKRIYKHKKDDVCFHYSMLQDDELAVIHFANAVVPKNPFKGSELKNRKKELEQIAKDLKKKHPKTKRVFGLSWIRNLKVYNDLMPESMKPKPYNCKGPYSGGHWGQFYRHDGSINEARVEQFKKTWMMPLKPKIGICPLKDFIDMYAPD